MAVVSKKQTQQGSRWLLLAAGAAALLAVVWFIFARSPQPADQAQLDQQTVRATRQDITVTVSAAGTIKPLTPVNISPKQPGRLAALYVDQGMQVRAGQILARMDDSNLQGQLLQAKGALAAAQANLRKQEAGNRPQEIAQAEQNLRNAEAQLIATRSTYESNEKLYAAGAVSRNTLDVSRSQYEASLAQIGGLRQQYSLQKAGFRIEDKDTARAQVIQAEGTLKDIQTQVNDTAIRAPFAGVITQKFANPGSFVTPTTSASATTSATSSSILAMAGQLEAVASVAESDIRNIYPGQKVQLQVDAYPDRTFSGVVRLVAPEGVVVQNVTSFEVRVRITDPDRRLLRSAMNLTAKFQVGDHKNALLVPTTAVLNEQGRMGVYVPGRTRAHFQPLKVGATVGAQTEVLAGLKEGDRVYITFPSSRRPNDRPVRSNNSPLGGPPGGSGSRGNRGVPR
ncbi:efflux RND transporter periplasmic adaptor subunit [Gloeobacter kilaueensis]|uniref:Efflux transporter, RND family, MFP subunit n=1 Tax=Gloeobacter kilaueensis (strain ATCC BAA-2537 / CCAP 1431/1 / ULC 316 / JS1) TaxID=1183438 RepID=U5QLC4_GLOK1|nr:efflux RND transporter periplasmic adaptor subunit [Gloeobacter kilaueensis]AGY58465.1 efflux transporter, RND family, MFP subunit [Gloeobacter kilaueensis JS1]